LWSPSIYPTEADRDVLDWSGKKPLDYQKQLTSISSATFSSEYKVMNNVIISNIQTLPTRQNTMKKNRNRERTGVQRSFTIMNDGGASSSRGSFDDTKSIDNFDTRSITGDSEASGFGSKLKEKRQYRASFLKKSMTRKRN
jgi:hypothetical protein